MQFTQSYNIFQQPTHYHLFGTLHLITLAIIFGLFITILKIIPQISQKSTKYFEICIVLITLTTTLYSSYTSHQLPLQLCTISSIVLVPGILIFRKRICSDLLIYCGAWGSLLAIITPGLNAQSAWEVYIRYFISHSCNVFTAIYAIIILGVTVDKKSLLNAIIYGNLYLILVSVYDYVAHTNYMYLNHKPPFNTLFNSMSPWPWYIIEAEFIGLTIAVFTYISIKYLRKYFSTEKQLVAH